MLRQQTGKAFCSKLTRVWRRSLGGTGGETVSSPGYSLTEYPIRAREKHYHYHCFIIYISKILEYKKLQVIHFEQNDYFSKFFCTTKLNYLKGLAWIVLISDECVQQIKRKHNFLFIYYILWTYKRQRIENAIYFRIIITWQNHFATQTYIT